MSELPRITFGIIVLNGEPFLRYTLRALYPFAHEIIVVEGAAPGAANIATPDGHSLDGTLDSLRAFKDNEDPEDKLAIVSRDGFWTEKDEMSASLCRACNGRLFVAGGCRRVLPAGGHAGNLRHAKRSAVDQRRFV